MAEGSQCRFGRGKYKGWFVLENTLVSAFRANGGYGSGKPMDSLTLNFTKLDFNVVAATAQAPGAAP
jgi:hypothetical protein